MEVEIIGQFYSFRRDFTNFQIASCPPFVCTSYAGDNRVLTYEIVQSCYENEDVKSEAKRRKHSNLKPKQNCRLSFLESHSLSFPVCFLVSTESSVWAVSHNSQKEIVLTQKPEDDPEKLPADQIMDIVPTEFNEQEEIGEICNGISVCSATKFSRGILVCYEDFAKKRWIVHEVRKNAKPVTLLQIQCEDFSYTPYSFYNDPELVHSARKGTCAVQKHQATVFCIEVENSFNKRNGNTVKKETFLGIFGFDILSDAVVLIGLPDGRILCYFMNLSDSIKTMHRETDCHMLCNIEQPVHHIDIRQHEEDGSVHDVIVIGTFGKIMVLSPAQASAIHSGASEVNFSPPFMFSVSYIPSPVNKIAVCHQGMLHTISDEDVWMTFFSKEKPNISGAQCGANISLRFQQLCYYGIKSVVALNNQREILMLVGSDGSILVGNFFGTNPINRCTPKEEMPILLKSVYDYGNQLQELDIEAQKQKRLFSALAVAAKIKIQGDHSLSISCKITAVLPDANKFLIAVEFQNLRNFMFDPELWTLSVTVSSVFQEGNTITKHCAWSPECPCIDMHVDSTFFANPNFPWLVEGGLLLDIPIVWKSATYFKSIQDLPLYVKIQRVLINELHMLKNNSLKWSDASSDDRFEHYGSKSVFTILQRIAKNHSIYNDFETLTTVRKYDLFQEFSVLVFASSIKSICSVTEDDDLSEKLIQHIVRKSDLVSIPSSCNFMCFGSPVSISVKRKEDFLCITFRCTSFPILIGLKMSLIQLLKESRCSETTEKSISISSRINDVLKELSVKISRLVCQDRCDIGEEELEVYKNLRKYVSADLHVL